MPHFGEDLQDALPSFLFGYLAFGGLELDVGRWTLREGTSTIRDVITSGQHTLRLRTSLQTLRGIRLFPVFSPRTKKTGTQALFQPESLPNHVERRPEDVTQREPTQAMAWPSMEWEIAGAATVFPPLKQWQYAVPVLKKNAADDIERPIQKGWRWLLVGLHLSETFLPFLVRLG